MNVARIKTPENVVVNIEVLPDGESLPKENDGYLLIAYDESNPAWVGSTWSETDGFEPVPIPLID
jgi:hypothetical protein